MKSTSSVVICAALPGTKVTLFSTVFSGDTSCFPASSFARNVDFTFTSIGWVVRFTIWIVRLFFVVCVHLSRSATLSFTATADPLAGLAPGFVGPATGAGALGAFVAVKPPFVVAILLS